MRTIYCRVFYPKPLKGLLDCNYLKWKWMQEVPFRGFRGKLVNEIRHLSFYITYFNKIIKT